MATSSIGSFRFIQLSEPPQPPKKHVEIIQRQGVNGSAIWETGTKGVPFSVRSKVDARDVAHAFRLWHDYVQTIGERLTITWGGQTPVYWFEWLSGRQSYYVVVLDVTEPLIRRVASSSGGLNYPHGAWLEATWKLLAVT